jgi:hypothetical protein
LPAEPPKVGLKSLAVAALTTRATKARGTVGESISDDVTITGLTSAGTLAWSFVGPVSPRQGSCSGVDFTGANVVKSGTTSVASDDTVRVGPVTTSSAGCYSWIQTLSYEVNPGDEVSVTSSPSDAAEITLVSNAPTMAVTGSNIVGVMAIGAASVLAGLFALWCARRRYE